MINSGMFKKLCDGCKQKEVFVYAKSKLGDLPTTYCSDVCKTNAQYKKRFDKRFK